VPLREQDRERESESPGSGERRMDVRLFFAPFVCGCCLSPALVFVCDLGSKLITRNAPGKPMYPPPLFMLSKQSNGG